MKQTVMTSVYGVTYVGAREQIKRRLKERGAIADDAELFSASCYAAKVPPLSYQRVIPSFSSYPFYLVISPWMNHSTVLIFVGQSGDLDCIGGDVSSCSWNHDMAWRLCQGLPLP